MLVESHRLRLAQQVLALFVIDGRQRLLEQPVNLRVRVATAIGRTTATIRIDGRQHTAQRRRGLARVGVPPDQDDAVLIGRVAGRRQEASKRLRHHLGGHADAVNMEAMAWSTRLSLRKRSLVPWIVRRKPSG